MGRSRAACAGPAGRGAGTLRRWLAALALITACSAITADFDRVIAIDILGPLRRTLEEGDTLTLEARAVSAAGDVVTDAAIVWQSIDTGTVGFDLDPATGLVSGVEPDSGRVQATFENLRAGPILITVLPAPDSVAPAGDTALVVDSTAAQSPALAVLTLDLTTQPGETLALPGIAVHFLTVEPAPGTALAEGFFLAGPGETEPGADPHQYVATSGSTGEAAVVVYRRSGVAQPDSAVVDAVVLTAVGDTVAGSPVRFHIRFLN